MARMKREELFAPDEIAVVHVMNRVVRRCFLLGSDPVTGKNFDHRKLWVEHELERVAPLFGIDLFAFAILSNHFHLVLRSRPDVVRTWDDREVARRWMTLCPKRKEKDGSAKPPNDRELNSILLHPEKLADIRSRLSDISWWMRLVCQRIGQKANAEENEVGKFWQCRYKAVRLLDEESILACTAYVDLNPIRSAIAETLETSDFTSIQRRIKALRKSLNRGSEVDPTTVKLPPAGDAILAPLEIDELNDPLGPRPATNGRRCSDKGLVAMPLAAYVDLLDWTARQIDPRKRGATPELTPALFERLTIRPEVWCEMVRTFGKLFSLVAGQPRHVDDHRGRQTKKRFYLRQTTRELLCS